MGACFRFLEVSGGLMLILPGSFLYCEGLVVTSVSSTVKVCSNFLFLLESALVLYVHLGICVGVSSHNPVYFVRLTVSPL